MRNGAWIRGGTRHSFVRETIGKAPAGDDRPGDKAKQA